MGRRQGQPRTCFSCGHTWLRERGWRWWVVCQSGQEASGGHVGGELRAVGAAGVGGFGPGQGSAPEKRGCFTWLRGTGTAAPCVPGGRGWRGIAPLLSRAALGTFSPHPDISLGLGGPVPVNLDASAMSAFWSSSQNASFSWSSQLCCGYHACVCMCAPLVHAGLCSLVIS